MKPILQRLCCIAGLLAVLLLTACGSGSTNTPGTSLSGTTMTAGSTSETSSSAISESPTSASATNAATASGSGASGAASTTTRHATITTTPGTSPTATTARTTTAKPTTTTRQATTTKAVTTTKKTTTKTTTSKTTAATTKPTTSGSTSSLTANQAAVLRIVNEERASAGLDPVQYYHAGQAAADTRAAEIEILFSHTRPNGQDWHTALTAAGVSYYTAGENIAYGYTTPEAVMTGWMNSQGHRANILNEKFTHLIVGFQDNHWVQLFVTPSSH